MLVVEDDLELRTVLLRGLAEEGFDPAGIGTGHELLERIWSVDTIDNIAPLVEAMAKPA